MGGKKSGTLVLPVVSRGVSTLTGGPIISKGFDENVGHFFRCVASLDTSFENANPFEATISICESAAADIRLSVLPGL